MGICKLQITYDMNLNHSTEKALAAVRTVIGAELRRSRPWLGEAGTVSEERRMAAAVAVLSFGFSHEDAAEACGVRQESVHECVCSFSRLRMKGDGVVMAVERHMETSRGKGWHDGADAPPKGGSWCLGFFISDEEETFARRVKLEAVKFMERFCRPVSAMGGFIPAETEMTKEWMSRSQALAFTGWEGTFLDRMARNGEVAKRRYTANSESRRSQWEYRREDLVRLASSNTSSI